MSFLSRWKRPLPISPSDPSGPPPGVLVEGGEGLKTYQQSDPLMHSSALMQFGAYCLSSHHYDDAGGVVVVASASDEWQVTTVAGGTVRTVGR